MNFLKICATVALTLAAGVASAANAEVLVINNSSYSVWRIYTSATNSKNYGSTDLLGDSTIPAGMSKVIDFNVYDADDSCWQDILAKSKEGLTWRKTFNVCKESTWTLNN